MALTTWWSGDSLLNLAERADFRAALMDDDRALASLNNISTAEVRARRAAGHRPYVAYVSDVPTAYGWVATQEAEIGELRLRFTLPMGNRYLWDFATLPEWQGQGLYPRLLQAIVQAEKAEKAERFWIIHAPENLPSGAGMQKAGFQAVGLLSFRRDRRVGLVPFERQERASAGAALLDVPLYLDELSPCWRCIGQVVCTCQLDPGSCSCAVPVRPGSLLM